MDANFINPVLRSMQNIFSTMIHLEPKVGSPTIKDKNSVIPGRNISGVMSMVGRKGVASIAITFPEPVILLIAQKMLPAAPATIDGNIIDLVGELANMVLGGAKSELENGGYFFKLSLPTIILGTDYLIAHRTNAPIILLPFSISEGEFFIEAGYEETSSNEN